MFDKIGKCKGMSLTKAKISYILLTIFVIFLLTGIFLGEVSKVIETAVNICLGCIGIG